MTKRIIEIEPLESDRQKLLDLVEILDARIHKATAEYVNSTAVVSVTEELIGSGGFVLEKHVNFGIKDVCTVGLMTQGSVGFWGGTDRGKTDLGRRVLGGAFGRGHFRRIEVNRAMGIEDMIDMDFKKLAHSRLSEAVTGAKWLDDPARLVDEVNRAHSKLVNVLLHLIDGSGFNVRGDLSIEVGVPYRARDEELRYSCSIVTANHADMGYSGVFEEDEALVRRVVMILDFDIFPLTPRDAASLTKSRSRRAKPRMPNFPSMLEPILTIYESLLETVPFSALGLMLLHYLYSLGTCVPALSGKMRPGLGAKLCKDCKVSEKHPFCGRVGGLSEGLLQWVKEIACAVALLRGARVLADVRQDCEGGHCDEIRHLLGSKNSGKKLFAKFREWYVERLQVLPDDVIAAYSLVAPRHLWLSPQFLNGTPAFEGHPFYAFRHVASESWKRLRCLLTEHEELFDTLKDGGEVLPIHQAEVEKLITSEDPATLGVISLIRDDALPLRFRESPADESAAWKEAVR